MFLKFTNAVKEHEGKSITVNMDKVISIFEKTAHVVTANESKEKTVTVLYAGADGSWEVEESYLNVIARVSAN